MPDTIKINAVVFDGTVVCQYSNNCITLKNNDNDSIDIITTKVLNRINTMINDDWGLRRKKVWLHHTSCGFTAYATVKEIGIPPHL